MLTGFSDELVSSNDNDLEPEISWHFDLFNITKRFPYLTVENERISSIGTMRKSLASFARRHRAKLVTSSLLRL